MGRKYTAMKEIPELREELNGGNSHLYNAMSKHGVDNFTVEVIEEASNDKLNDLEEKYINEYDSIAKGYNIRTGGNRTVHTDETKKFISQRTKEAFNKPEVVNKLRKHSEKLEGLPPKCTYGFNNKRECIRIRRHPLCKDKSFYVANYKSYDDCKNAVIEYFNELEKNNGN